MGETDENGYPLWAKRLTGGEPLGVILNRGTDKDGPDLYAWDLDAEADPVKISFEWGEIAHIHAEDTHWFKFTPEGLENIAALTREADEIYTAWFDANPMEERNDAGQSPTPAG